MPRGWFSPGKEILQQSAQSQLEQLLSEHAHWPPCPRGQVLAEVPEVAAVPEVQLEALVAMVAVVWADVVVVEALAESSVC